MLGTDRWRVGHDAAVPRSSRERQARFVVTHRGVDGEAECDDIDLRRPYDRQPHQLGEIGETVDETHGVGRPWLRQPREITQQDFVSLWGATACPPGPGHARDVCFRGPSSSAQLPADGAVKRRNGVVAVLVEVCRELRHLTGLAVPLESGDREVTRGDRVIADAPIAFHEDAGRGGVHVVDVGLAHGQLLAEPSLKGDRPLRRAILVDVDDGAVTEVAQARS